MEVNYSLTEDDFLALQRHCVDHPPPGSGCAGRALILGPLYFGALGTVLLCGMLFPPSDQVEVAPWGPILPGIMIVGSLLVYLLRHQITAHFARRALRSAGMAKYLAPHQMRLTSEGLAVSSETGANLSYWSSLLSIAVGPEHAFLFLNVRQALIVPKRAFADEQAFEQFVEKARQHVAAAKERSGA